MAIIDRINIGGNLFDIKDIAANQFVTKAVSDLLYYYTKDETFTKDEIRALIAQIQGMSIIPVQVLPTASAETMGNIYLVPSSDPETRNLYDEYFTIESGGSYSWEIFGSAAISLDGLVTDEELESALSGKVDKVPGKGLSTNDYTDADKAKVGNAYVKPLTGIPASDLNTLQLIGAPSSYGTKNEEWFAEHICSIADFIKMAQGEYLFAKGSSGDSSMGYDFIYHVAGATSHLLGIDAYSVEFYSGDNAIIVGYTPSQHTFTFYESRGVKPSDIAAWNAKYTKPSTGIPASDLAADVIPDVSGKANTSELSQVAFSGDYDDLANKPTIPSGVVVDQTYDGTSQNAQSGVAMAGALAGKQDKIDSTHKLDYSLIDNTPTIPDAVTPNPTVPSGTTPTDLTGLKVGNGYYGIPQPTVDNTPTKNSANLVKSGGVYAEVHPGIVTTQPVGGFAPGIVYDLGELTGTVTFALASPSDATIPNAYHWTFDTGSTAPTITWPVGIIWPDGFTPSVDASKHYEVLVRNGYASMLSYSLS